MSERLNAIKGVLAWFADQAATDYRNRNAALSQSINQNVTHLNQIILTVSVAVLASIAGFNKALVEPNRLLAFTVITLFVLVILISVINIFYITKKTQAVYELSAKKIIFSKKDIDEMNLQSLRNKTNRMNLAILILFCTGLLAYIVLIGFGIFGGTKW